MNDVVATMPVADVMTEALRSVLDEPQVCEHLYPLVCDALAGKERRSISVVVGLLLAVHDYSEELDQAQKLDIRARVPDFIEAITPPVIRTKALEFWDEYMRPV